eukprot:572329-Alexandrium_andersonii.AAC.1
MNTTVNRCSPGDRWGLVEGVGNVGPEGADLARAEFPEGLHRVGDDVREPQGDNALALADEAVGQGSPK